MTQNAELQVVANVANEQEIVGTCVNWVTDDKTQPTCNIEYTKRLGMASGVRDWRSGRTRADKLFWAACLLLGTLFLWFGLTKLAGAHIPGHEEWNNVLSTSKNQYNGQCCGLGDAHLVEFDDWQRTIDGNYEFYLLGQWRRIEPWKITINQVNPTGKAIVWYDADPGEDDDSTVRVIIYCFKPLDTY